MSKKKVSQSAPQSVFLATRNILGYFQESVSVKEVLSRLDSIEAQFGDKAMAGLLFLASNGVKGRIGAAKA